MATNSPKGLTVEDFRPCVCGHQRRVHYKDGCGGCQDDFCGGFVAAEEPTIYLDPRNLAEVTVYGPLGRIGVYFTVALGWDLDGERQPLAASTLAFVHHAAARAEAEWKKRQV